MVPLPLLPLLVIKLREGGRDGGGEEMRNCEKRTERGERSKMKEREGE
jgi:hypothetical protein